MYYNLNINILIFKLMSIDINGNCYEINDLFHLVLDTKSHISIYSIVQLINLKTLILSDYRQISLPDAIGNLINLTEFTLYYSDIKSLPDTIGNLVNLTTLCIFNTDLSSIPDVIGNLTNLTSLSLQNNQLKLLPESIGNLTNLTNLYLEKNQLLGILESIGNLVYWPCYNRLWKVRQIKNELGRWSVAWRFRRRKICNA